MRNSINQTTYQDTTDVSNYNRARFLYAEATKQAIDEICKEYIKTRLEKTDLVNISILGCHNGKNDLYHLLNWLKTNKKLTKGKKINIYCCDSSLSNLKVLLKDKFSYTKTLKYGETTKGFKIENSTVFISRIDIETDFELTYTKLLGKKGEKFDFVIAFFVLHHLTNTPLVLFNLYKFFNGEGKLFNLLDKGDIVSSIENNPNSLIHQQKNKWDNHLLKYVKAAHEAKLILDGVSYSKQFLASYTKGLSRFDTWFLKEEKELEELNSSAQVIDKSFIEIIFKRESQYAPFGWGDRVQEDIGSSEKFMTCDTIKIEDNPVQSNVRSNYVLEVYSKKEHVPIPWLHDFVDNFVNFSYRRSVWKFRKDLDVFNSIKSSQISSVDKKEVLDKKRELLQRLFIQYLLTSNVINPETVFISNVLWEMKMKDAQIDIDFNISIDIPTLVSTRTDGKFENFKKVFTNYILALSNAGKASISSLIFKEQFRDFIWIIQLGDSFDIRILEKSVFGLKKFIITLPKFNLDTKTFIFKDAFWNNLYREQKAKSYDYQNFSYFSFNNQRIKELAPQDGSVDEKNAQLKNLLNLNEVEKLKIQKELRKIIFEDDETENKIAELAIGFEEILPKFQYLINSINGRIVYITNSFYDFSNRKMANGGIIIGEPYEENKNVCSEIKETDNYRNYEYTGMRLRYFQDFLNFFTREIIPQEIHRINSDETNKQAAKAAISQVMARNMSHNIGSHVISKYKNYTDLKQYFDIPEIRSIELNRPEANKDLKFPEQQYSAKNLKLNENLLGIYKVAYFNEYLKNRMDFLADIATTDPTMESPMYLVKEIMRGIDKNRILLDRISGVSEKIQFDFKVRRLVNNKWEELVGDRSEFDSLISVPNDILGCQAFYIIIENIIRNITKHSKFYNKEKRAMKFVLNIDIEDYYNNQNYYQVHIYDNLFKNEEEIKSLVKSRNEAFNKPILDKQTSRLRSGSLGTIEMAVCAAYLRKYPLSGIEDSIFKVNESMEFKRSNNKSDFNKDEKNIVVPHLIYAYMEDAEDKRGHSLGYSLCLRKSQTLLILDDNDTLRLSDEQKEKLRRDGIWVLKRKDEGQHNYNEGSIYNHEFLIWMNGEAELNGFLKRNFGGLPKRVLRENEFDGGFKIDDADPTNTIKDVWIKYASYKFKHTPISVTNKIITSNFPELNHHDNQIQIQKVFLDGHGDNWESERENFDYYDVVCSHHKIDALKKKILRGDRYVLAQYAETVITKILIIDERIQHNILGSETVVGEEKNWKKYSGKIPFYELFQKQNILIPDFVEANLNITNFGVLSDKEDANSTEADKIRTYVTKHKSKCDFIVLHMGILEKMLPERAKKGESEIDNLLKLMFDDDERHKIVITSGRGKPDNIPINLCFVSLAILQNAIETLFDKFLLVKLLYNSRRTTN